jgi:transmembrane sensor
MIGYVTQPDHMNQIDFRQLLENYVTGKLLEHDERKFFDLLQDEKYRNILAEVLHEEWNEGNYIDQPNAQLGDRIERYILNRIADNEAPPVRSISFFRRYRNIAAAIILIIIGVGSYLWFNKRSNSGNDIAKTISQHDIPPGGNKAVLTLDDGSTILLDSAARGTLALQGSTKVLKTNEGQLAYNIVNEEPTEILYNTLTTPRGGQYQLVLPDGSKVWLNAASSIRYPTSFIDKERKVEITGEAYFEVEKNTRMPFIIEANDMDIKVLGTHFNVNAYSDEAMAKTTLLEGSVLVARDTVTALLKPGQQAQITTTGTLKVINNADIDEAVAWKNGVFYFNRADIQTIMRQISRWYDVDIQYQGEINPKKFGGEIQRDLNLSEVLEGLKQTGIHFRIEGKKLIVLP